MTRKEWMLKNHPDVRIEELLTDPAHGDYDAQRIIDFVDPETGETVMFPMGRGGVVGCPGNYLDLVDIDPSTAELRSPDCHMYPHCTDCWNQEIPGTKKTRPNGFRLEKKEEPELSVKEAIDRATCDCDTCVHQDLCRFECQFRGMTKEIYKHCIEEATRYSLSQLGIQMRPLHCKRYEPSPAIEKLNTAVFQLKAQHLTDEMIRKIFDEEPKENK